MGILLKIAGGKLRTDDGHGEAYALLQTLWREHTDRPFPKINRTELGKPYFEGETVHFSITHTKHFAFCAFSDVPVGIDAEETERKIKPALAEKILSPEEYAQYISVENKNRALLTFWVLKEAQAKCSGRGIGLYPNKTRFMLSDSRVREIDGCLVAVIKETDKDAF